MAECDHTLVTGRTVVRAKAWSADAAGRIGLSMDVGAKTSDPVPALCIGPGEWLLVSADHIALPAEQGLVLVDLTDGFAVIEVQGAAACDVLSKGCALDLHPRSFPPRRCARTRFAQIPVVIDRLDTSRFELYVARSYADYLRSWLTDACTEFDV